MAQSRLIDKSISLSEKANSISDGAALLYTWMIPHSDDFGLLQGSAFTLKALVAPMKSWSIAQVEDFITEMHKVGLVKTVTYKGKQYYYILNGKQSLKKDRQPQTILPLERTKDAGTSWKTGYSILEELGKHLEDNGKHLETEEKRSEEKNNLPNGKLVQAPEAQTVVSTQEDKRNPLINHVLEEFKRVYGFYPTDKKPRYVAQNLVQRIKTVTADRFGGEVTQDRLQRGITMFFNWLQDQDGLEGIQKLETAKLKLNIFMETLPRKEQRAAADTQG